MGAQFLHLACQGGGSRPCTPPVTPLLQTCVVSFHCTRIEQPVYNHIKSYSYPAPVISSVSCIRVVQWKLNTLHQWEVQLFNQWHFTPVVGKLLASAQLCAVFATPVAWGQTQATVKKYIEHW